MSLYLSDIDIKLTDYTIDIMNYIKDNIDSSIDFYSLADYDIQPYISAYINQNITIVSPPMQVKGKGALPTYWLDRPVRLQIPSTGNAINQCNT